MYVYIIIYKSKLNLLFVIGQQKRNLRITARIKKSYFEVNFWTEKGCFETKKTTWRGWRQKHIWLECNKV